MEIMDEVLSKAGKIDFNEYDEADVTRALLKENVDEEDFAALLSPAAGLLIEEMAQKAKKVTRRYFGNGIGLYTPLYIANYCVNQCVYCGFNCMNKIHRGKLTFEEMEMEYKCISNTGLKEILLLTGESRTHSDLDYIGHAVEMASEYFTTIGIEIYPINADEYSFLHKKGADFVSVYQETYDTKRYNEVHLRGPKKDFEYRFNSQERAILGGMRGVGVGALLGLGDFRKDAFSAGLHAKLLQKKYPHAELSFSVPRLRPYINNSDNSSNDVHEPQLLQVMMAYRMFMPYAGINISTRERAGFRDNVIGLIATKISAGVKTSVGGHESSEKGDSQFVISDERSVSEISSKIASLGLQPIYTDYIRI